MTFYDDVPEDWNMAKAYLFRLDQLFNLAADYKMSGRFDEWFRVLINVYFDVSPKMKPDERKEVEDLFLKARQQLSRKHQVNKAGMPLYDYDDLTVIGNFELFLRDFMEKKGMFTPHGDDPSKAYR